MQAAEGAGRTGSRAAWSARLPELSAAGGRAAASRAPRCRHHLSRRHFRNRATWSGRAAREGQARAPRERLAGGGGGGGSLPRPLAPRSSCVRGTEPTRRARADQPLLLPPLPPPSSHVIIRLHGLGLRLWPRLSPSPVGRARASSRTVTSGGRRSLAWSVPGEEDGGAVRWWLHRC